MVDPSDTPMSPDEWHRMLAVMQTTKNMDQSVPSGHASPVTVAAAFFNEMDRREEVAHPFKLSDPITENEWHNARPRPRAVIDKWFYEDVGAFIAPGGTGKTAGGLA